MDSACDNGRLKEFKRFGGSIRFALFKILCRLSHGVRNMRKTKNSTLVGGGKGVKRRGFHFDRKNTSCPRSLY